MGLFRFCCAGLGFMMAAQPLIAADTVQPSAEQLALVQRAVERGQLMQVYDKAAWITTDDMMAKLPRSRWLEVGGWVVTPAGKGVHIDYIGKGAHAPQAIYSADVVDGKIASSIVHTADAMPLLSDFALRMQHALTIARAELVKHDKWGMCADREPNSVTLPPDADGTIPVYLMTPQVKTGEIPFGGHYEIDVAADGTVKSSRAFTNSCLTLRAIDKPKEKVAGLFMGHILDAQPNEIHVFEQIAAGLPVYVITMTSDMMWNVYNGQVRFVGPAPKQAKP